MKALEKVFFKSFGNICDGFVSLDKDFKDLIESFEGIWKAVKVNSKVFTNLCNAFIGLEKDFKGLAKGLEDIVKVQGGLCNHFVGLEGILENS